jgi:hypothetical protein
MGIVITLIAEEHFGIEIAADTFGNLFRAVNALKFIGVEVLIKLALNGRIL